VSQKKNVPARRRTGAASRNVALPDEPSKKKATSKKEMVGEECKGPKAAVHPPSDEERGCSPTGHMVPRTGGSGMEQTGRGGEVM